MDFYNSQMLNADLNGLTVSADISTNQFDTRTDAGNALSCWNYWQDNYYPQVICTSYPVYLQERAKDSGKQAFEVIKALLDKKLMKLEKVSDFIEAMDTLIKVL